MAVICLSDDRCLVNVQMLLWHVEQNGGCMKSVLICRIMWMTKNT